MAAMMGRVSAAVTGQMQSGSAGFSLLYGAACDGFYSRGRADVPPIFPSYTAGDFPSYTWPPMSRLLQQGIFPPIRRPML